MRRSESGTLCRPLERSQFRLQGNSEMATEDARKLFVAGLPESITEDVLRQLFEATGGKVVEVSLPKDRATGKARGFGFVTFAVSDEASRARDALDGSMQAGRAISVRPFSSEPPKRGERSDLRSDSRSEMPAPAAPAEDRTLYVGNLPYDTNQQELSQLFQENGVTQVVRMHLPTGPDGRLRGFGFVTLASAEAANLAITALRSAEVRGRRLMINIAHPRGAPGAGGPSDRPRPRPEMMGRSGEPRFPTEPPMNFEGARPPVERRRVSGAPEGADFSAEDAKRKKKRGVKGASRERGTEARRRGGGTNWQALDDREEDEG
jgi:RNA recognition motif-containing protein